MKDLVREKHIQEIDALDREISILAILGNEKALRDMETLKKRKNLLKRQLDLYDKIMKGN